MSLFEMVLKSVYANQQCVNRWNYVGSGTPAAVSMSFALASAAGFIAGGEPPAFPLDTLFAGIRGASVETVEFNEIIVMNVYDPTDFYTTAFPDNTLGLQTGTGSPPFEAGGLRSNIVNRTIARGTKRFVGVPKVHVGGGGELNPAYVANLQFIADKMALNLTYDDEGNTVTFAPCVVSKEKYTTPSGKTAYKYYATLAAQMARVAQGIAWEPYDTVRTQVSRQGGHGN